MKNYIPLIPLGLLLTLLFSCKGPQQLFLEVEKNNRTVSESLKDDYPPCLIQSTHSSPISSDLEIYTWQFARPFSDTTITFSGRGLSIIDAVFIGDSRGQLINGGSDSLLTVTFNKSPLLVDNTSIKIYYQQNQKPVMIELAERFTRGKQYLPQVKSFELIQEDYVFNDTKGILFECKIRRLAPRAASTTAYLGNQAISPYQLNVQSDRLTGFLSYEQLSDAKSKGQAPLLFDFGYGLKSIAPNSQQLLYK